MGLQMQVKHPVGHGLNFMANYTFSHSFTNRYLGDYYQADGALVDYTTLRDPHLNRVPSPYDLRHVLKVYFTYDLPFGAGQAFKTENSFINRIIGGWTIGSRLLSTDGAQLQTGGWRKHVQLF